MVYVQIPRSKARVARDFRPPLGSASVHLDALRGLAAISVMYAHWWDAFYASYSNLPSRNPILAAAYCYSAFGHAWVIVFFVLSGYLVGGSVLRAMKNRNWSWRAYLLARFTRLYVVLLPALLLGAALYWAGMHLNGAETLYSGHSGMGALYFNVYSTLTPKVFVNSLLFMDTKGAAAFGSNGPLWSLSHEFWYYIAFPILAIALSKGQRFWIRGVTVLALMAWAWLVGGYKVALFPTWLMGVLILYMPPFPTRSPWSQPWIRRLAIAISLALLLVAFVLRANGSLFPDSTLTVGRSHWHPPISDILLSPVVALFIWVVLQCAPGRLSAAYAWLAQRAAGSSYTLYLVHLPAIIFLKAFFHIPRAIPSWQTFPFNLAMFLIVFLYAQLVYLLFERKTDWVRQRIKPYVMGQIGAKDSALPNE